ncbi:hypothetical protein [Tunicatimonas pelagia]|uniref:hypothetical protein n=1 Tax=Tunicatimonas pelagia TaxID=931531 RepID=UPI002666144E|nr:hypothetical protein [Tunicatimonas pelagia]WKN44229.1 hypothetical protein P0M28_04520 [Tunicatimonas pelagia]
MKTAITLLLVLLSICLTSYSQEYKRFKVSIDVPFSIWTSDQFNYYGGFTVEPAWRWNDKWSTGIYATLIESDSQSSREFLSETGAALSLGLTADRYLRSTSRIRPFAGLQLGRTAFVHQQVERTHFDPHGTDWGEVIHYSGVGYTMAPRIGCTLWHVRTFMMYQISTHGIPDMFTFQMGIEIGGGRKKQKSNKKLVYPE